MLCHAVHLGLKFAGGDWPSPLMSDQLRSAQIIFDLLFDLLARNHRIERRLRRTIVFRPNPVTPVNFFNRSLIRHTVCKR
jgi:hypothetical protein